MAASGGPLELHFVRHQVLMTSLQQVPEYMELLKIQKKVAPGGTIRQVLSYHTSRECWPKKKGGPLQSLKSAGLVQKILFAESPLAPVPDSAFFIKVELVSAFSDGDGMGFEFPKLSIAAASRPPVLNSPPARRAEGRAKGK